MRRAAVLLVAVVLGGLTAGPARADKVEVKGPHICCKQCINIAEGLLKKVDGVSDAKADVKSKTVTFTAADEKAAKAGVQALIEGGFFGTATCDGKALTFDVPKGEGKATAVVVEKVHVCCGQCQKAITNLFKDAKVSYEGPSPQRTVRIEAADLDRAAVIETLRKAGFNGTLAK
jgi:copper chaperone CopZ